MYTVLDSWWWTVNQSETCRVLFQNKFEKLVHLFGCYYTNVSRRTVLWMSNLLSDPLLPTPVGDKGPCVTWPHSKTRTITHTHTHTHTLGKIPLDEGSARRRYLYVVTRNTHKKQTAMPEAVFKPANPARERTRRETLIRVDTGMSSIAFNGSHYWSVLV